jgi:Fe-Mn family superoxide dismutase
MSSTKTIDIEQIAKDVAEQVRKDFLNDATDAKTLETQELPKQLERAINSKVAEINEAYVPQRKTYAMTTDYLSEQSKKDHENLYRNYTSTLVRVSAEVDAADKTDVSSTRSAYRSAKQDEIYNLNATYLHELYFSNCFDPNSELFLDSMSYMRLASDWGSFDAWMADFMACALAARNGWVICGYSLYLKKLVNVFVDGHDQGVLVGIIPMIVVDMWEHSYTRDYGVDKKSYLMAMMREISWDVVEDRVTRMDTLKKVVG